MSLSAKSCQLHCKGVEIPPISRLNEKLPMVNPVKTFLIKLTKKCVISLLIGLLTLAAYGLWLFIQDPGNVAEQRSRVIAATELELSQLKSEQVQLDTAKREASTTLAAQQARRQQAEKSLKTLHQLDPSLWERIFGDAETQQRQQTWVARMDQVKAEAVARSVELQRQLREIDSRWQALSERLQAVEQTHLAAVADRQAVVYYLQRSWIEARWLAAGVILVFLFARLLLSLLFFYVVAPRVVRGQAVQFSRVIGVRPWVQESALSAEAALWPGEVLRIRPSFLQASDEGLARRRCLVLNWRRAFSCLASGLTGLIELRNSRNSGERRVCFASRRDPLAELTVVSVPEGGSFILRAGFLMGVITPGPDPVTLRRHLRLFNWQSWVSGRFGYWEFVGPCRLIVSCVSTVNVEVMSPTAEGELPSRRAAQAGVVGFSPQLALKPLRCAGFWRYYRERRPLYEVELKGCGVFLASESGGLARARMRGNEGPLVKVLKLIGL
jgi:hypothetical protein